MKAKLIITSAIALFAIGGAAHAQTAGHVGLNYQRVELDAGGVGEADVDAGQIEGAVGFDLGGLGAQVDGTVTRFDGDGDDATVWSATGHLNAKMENALVGGFVGLSDSDGVTLWTVGAEGQAALGESAQIYGQLGYGQADDLDDVDFWAGRAELRFFPMDNVKLQGVAGYTKADSNVGDVDVWTIGADAEYQFANMPLSIIGSFEHAELDDVDLETNTFRIGVRYTFGGSLKERDASGASLGSAANLFGGTLGQTLIAALGSF